MTPSIEHPMRPQPSVWAAIERKPVGEIRSARCRQSFVWILATLVCLVVSTATDAEADDVSAAPVADSVWYDAETGQIRAVEVEEQSVDAANRDSRWSATAKKKKTATPAGPSFWSDIDWGGIVGWLVLVLLLVGLAGIVIWVFRQSEFDFVNENVARQTWIDGMTLDAQTQQRISQLPSELRHTRQHPKQRASELKDAGDLDAALVFLFGHQLLLLDRVGWLRLTRGKTNHRYIREARSNQPAAGDILRATVAGFERSYFGKHAISVDEFDQLWNLNEQLESMVAANGEVAA